VQVVRDGDLPVLAAGASQLVRFRKVGGDPRAPFEAVVRQSAAAPPVREPSIHARRLAWMSRPHRILAPEALWGADIADRSKKNTNTGFLAHARWHQQAKGLVPSWKEPPGGEFVLPDVARAEGLMKEAEEALGRAAKLEGPAQASAREREQAAAAAAFREAIELYPEWKLDGLDTKNPWAVVGARNARARVWATLGDFTRACIELEAALEATGKQKDARSYVQMLIGDVHRQAGDLDKAEEAYLRAQKTGLYGDRKAQVPQRLEAVRKAKAAAVPSPTP